MEGEAEVQFLDPAVMSRHFADCGIQVIKACGDIDQAKRTINAVERTYAPLEKTLYGDRVVLLTQ